MAPAIDELEEQIRSAFRHRAAQLPATSDVVVDTAVRPARRSAPHKRHALLAAALVLIIVAGVAIVVAARDSSDRPPISGSPSSVPIRQIPSGVSVQPVSEVLTKPCDTSSLTSQPSGDMQLVDSMLSRYDNNSRVESQSVMGTALTAWKRTHGQ